MGLVDSSRKTNNINLSLLRGKNFFREVAQPRAIRVASTLDGERLRRKSIILAKRKISYRLGYVLVMSLILLAFSLAFVSIKYIF